ncbi:NADPH-dependent 2,4-dienoyl-CoA reductase/sulfur reductase-like enzyme [Paucibacter oligotrophus]|uniref:NADPH-dependent 2,4-dienoyl-CoA reductase/sulfur reductase-like enzyme n=1 Tax=Roseateles oligotrophus TaxID=1769250 RepID=A0A840LJS5_9BURK|nr:FAD-dependent oxidoreductase [Roseateles oligotrophus]MBB4845537.1 NADPH-dependent 2,4-dienoyl-CoA reductase/sulfur reductase-like enzyme [Roseateles oligotrophus]
MSTAQVLKADLLVVGAGPAGIAAVCEFVKAGRSVIWLDQGLRAGGQIWRAQIAAPWRQRLEQALASPLLRFLPGHAVIAVEASSAQEQRLLLSSLQEPLAPGRQVAAPQLLLALGARERLLPLPGWTLPGVHGAGGLQALIKNGWPIRGRRLLLAGSGPLLLAAADTARAAGAQVLQIIEQAPRSALLGFGLRLGSQHWAQAAGLAWRLRGTPYKTGCWVSQALGEHKLEAVQISDGQASWTLDCEALGLGFGLQPNTELAALLACTIEDGAIKVDARQQSSRAGIYAAGECTGVGGVGKALLEGQLAARQMLGQDGRTSTRALRLARRHARLVAEQFDLRPELFKLAEARTLICRCEDVSLGELKPFADWRSAKLQTRCGMGACQGRICGPIAQDVLGWPAQTAERGMRTPLQPTSIACLLGDDPA